MRRDITHYGPQPELASAELALLLAQLDQATAEWSSQFADDLTEDELVWQPFPGGHSIAGLLTHIADAEYYWLHHVAGGETPFETYEIPVLGAEIDQFAVQWPTPIRRPYAFYRELLQTTREKTRAVVAQLADPLFVASRPGRDGQTVEFTLRWILTHVITHEAYHGGQAVLLLLQQRERER